MLGYVEVYVSKQAILNLKNIINKADDVITKNMHTPNGEWVTQGLIFKRKVWLPKPLDHDNEPLCISYSERCFTHPIEGGARNYAVSPCYPYAQIMMILNLVECLDGGRDLIMLGEELALVYNNYSTKSFKDAQ
ncbi:hypothetical protein GD1_197 [Paraglaciecola Antarctic GD virus 1]|nr:hypothetical protein GD1_197 [Paraglaciecola Antarctic GD virus 1]